MLRFAALSLALVAPALALPHLEPVTVTETCTVTVTECATVIPQPSVISTIIPHPSETVITSPLVQPILPVETVVTSTYVQPTIHLSTGTSPPSYPTIKPSGPIWHNTTITHPTSVYTPTTIYTTTSVAPPATCPTTLIGSPDSGNWQFPHLIIPISSSSPDTAAGTSYFGTISPNTSTIFNFDIPASYAGKTCSLNFLLPRHEDLETSSYSLSGSGAVEFERLSSIATLGTTFHNAPAVASKLGIFALTEGSSTAVSTFACPAGSAVAYEAKAIGDTDLYFFQDYNPSPLGLYITTC